MRFNLNIDASDFEGDPEDLSRILEKKLKSSIIVKKKLLRIENDLSTSNVRDALKQTLHKLEPKGYHVISKSGSLIIKKMKKHYHKEKKDRRTPPSAPQSMPYFFPR